MFEDDEFKKLFKHIIENMQQEIEGLDGLSELMKDGDTRVVTKSWGARITRTPDGKVHIERFGNVPMIPELKGNMQPLIDVFEEGDEYIIVADVPGVEEDKIVVELREDGDKRTLIISSLDERRKYHKELDIPANVASEFEKRYRNGVLELRFKILKEA